MGVAVSAMQEYLMFVREDSVIPQYLVKSFIDKRKNFDSLKKLMSTDYLTIENRATLRAVLRHVFLCYSGDTWDRSENLSFLEYFVHSLTWVTVDNCRDRKAYVCFVKRFAPLLRALIAVELNDKPAIMR